MTDDIILCIKKKEKRKENSKDATRKPLGLINEFSKFSEHKTNTQKSIALLHNSNEMSEKEIQEIFTFTIESKRIKYLDEKKTKHLSKQRGFPSGSDDKEFTWKCGRHWFDPWVRKMPWRREWLLTPVFLPGEFHGQRNSMHRL